jgi:predicted CXXCH cytochrome family protein
MPRFELKHKAILMGILLFAVGVLLYACAETPQKRTLGGAPTGGKKFVGKECLNCHKKFADKYLGMKDIHAPVKEKKCEDCHLRHGIVPKLLLKKEGNEICYPCHSKDKIGMNKSSVHTALKRGRCIQCHNPHASQASHLLKAEGNEACYQCHKKENYEKKVLHKVGAKGCTTCHLAHSSDQKDLLVKAETPLCVGCHDFSKASFKKAHENYPVNQASCSVCHNPHSSLQAKLLKTSTHEPVASVQCDACHKPASDPKPFGTTETGSKLCYNCHDASKLKAGGTVEHSPFKEG